MIVDPPDPFAPLADWRAFRTTMKGLQRKNPDDQEVADGLALADERIAALETAK